MSTNHKTGYITAEVSALTRTTDGAVLPNDRLVYQNPNTLAYGPLPSVTLYTVTKSGVQSFAFNLGIFLQPSDQPGTYSGTITFKYNIASPTNDNFTMAVTIDIAPWASVAVSVNPITVASTTWGPHDDLTGQVQVTVTANRSWTLNICALGNLQTTGGAVLNANQVQYSLNKDDPASWQSLPSTPTLLTSGTGNTTFTLYFRVTDPISRHGGSYLGPNMLKLEIISA